MSTFASIPKGAKPSKSCSKDATRPALTSAEVVNGAGAKFLYATDSYKLARVTIHDPDDIVTPGPISVDALKAIEKAGGQFRALNGTIELPNGVSMPRPDRAGSTRFPDCAQLIPDEPVRVFKLGLNATLLKELADSLSKAGPHQAVTLTFNLDNVTEGECYKRGIRVDAGGEVGVIMPVRV